MTLEKTTDISEVTINTDPEPIQDFNTSYQFEMTNHKESLFWIVKYNTVIKIEDS